MKIYNQQGRILYEGQVEDNSYASDAIMDDNSLTLYIKTTEPLELPVGAYCTFENQKYTLMRPESFKKNNSRNFSYTVTMESDAAKAKIWKFRNPVDGRLQFSLTAKPIEHLQMVVDNLNRRDGGWSVGQCIDDVEHTITYDHNYIIDALVAQATEFNTEYEFKGKVVNLRKVEYNKNNPLPLSYGRGNGFKTGVGRSNQNENMPVEILFVQGGTKNIDPSQYGHKELLLPEGGEIAYDGQYFEDEEGFNEKTARHYIVSEDRLSIRRDDGVLSTLAEDSLDCSGVYPKREGLVSEVITVDAEKNFYDFTDSSIPSTLNFEDHLIEGEKMTVIFQSGMLAGRGEFEVKYYHDAQDGKLGRRFEIVPQEIDGETMPNETYKPSKDDKYAVFNCTLPEEYMNDKEHKQGAEWDMFRTAVKYKYENEDQKFTFTGTLDGIWSKKDWINIGGRIILGGYISFSDNQFQKEGVNVRITAVKKYINNPHSPEITLSNSTVTGSVTGTLNELQAQEVVIQETRREAIQYTKRRFRDAQETSEMLRALIDSSVDSLTQQFTEGITPISIQTMQLLVGDESLQFRYVNSDKNPQPVGDGITYDTEMKQLHAPERIVQHMTLGISTISSSHNESEYKFWRVAEYNSAVLEDADKKYYLYIKAAENGTGSYTLSEKALDFKEGTTYNLLVGVLNSEYDGVRSFATLYGFTEILPSRITTDKIVSGDGTSYFDMQNNAMKLGDAMDFNSDGTKKLKLKGTLVQSESGDFIDIGSFRGEYNSKTTYFLGDTVTYTPSGKKTSTYKSISEQPFTGIAPTNELYWSLTAAGGEDGTSISIKGTTNGHYTNKNAFVTAGHTSGTFLIDMKEDESPVSYHWVAKRSGSTWAYSQAELGDGYMDAEGYLWVAEGNGWSNVGKIKGEDGQDGTDGKDGVSYTGTDEYYQWHNSATTAPTGTWSKNAMPTKPADTTYRYLWNYEVIKLSNGTTQTSAKHVISADGKGIKSITEYYALTNSATAPSASSTAWSTTISVPTSTNRYLWNKEVVTYNDNTTSVTIRPLSQRGQDGTDGQDGQDGADGEYTEYRFARNGSTTTPPTISKTSPTPSGWSLTMPATGLGWYTWATKARKTAAGALVENWCTPFRITPYDGQDGQDGQQGKSPAAIYRGTYDASKTYYGNEFRLDVVKYGSTYYIAQITAGTFSNVVPTNTSKWNAFGASFDSVATNLLLAENANVGGWIFRNGVLESENGSSWLNGKTGQARLRGTMQLSTAYKGVTTDANIFYMPAITASKSVGLTAEKTDIGKVCRFYNSSAKGGGTWTIYIYEDVTCTQDADGNTYTSRYKYTGYRLAPKESIEFTCFERKPPNSYEKSYSLSWQCTNRFTVNEWQQESCKGRYPRILAMGKITGTSNTAYLSGEFHDGRRISSVFSVSRSGEGKYTVSFASGTLPSGYFVFVVGSSPIYRGSNPNKASIDSKGTTSFVVSTSDDASRNDGSVDFIIFSPNWSYSTDWD